MYMQICIFYFYFNPQDVMRRLVSRYIHQTKKQLRQDGVNEDDLLEIKQDISSLRWVHFFYYSLLLSKVAVIKQ